MSFFAIASLFFLWRIVDFLILFLAPQRIPYLGFFPYITELKKFHLPQWMYSLANFDGVHYIKIAQHGYEQYEQAFFPLYPFLMRIINFITHNSLISGLLISNISFVLGLWVFSKYKGGPRFWTILLLLLFPTSFFFGAVYTEGLFFVLVVCFFYFLEKKHYVLSGLFGFFASLTRLMGVLLIIPIVLYSLKQKKFSFLILFPVLGFLLYSFYLFKTVGDPLFFLTAQPVFGAHRSTSIVLLPQVFIRYLKIFFTVSHGVRFYVSLFEFCTFTFVLFILIIQFVRAWKRPKNYSILGLNLFSIANLLLPTLTGTFSSIPRYTLVSLSFFIFLGSIRSTAIKILLGILFFIFHIIVLGFFGQGYFIS